MDTDDIEHLVKTSVFKDIMNDISLFISPKEIKIYGGNLYKYPNSNRIVALIKCHIDKDELQSFIDIINEVLNTRKLFLESVG
jgi:hypothetical protein